MSYCLLHSSCLKVNPEESFKNSKNKTGCSLFPHYLIKKGRTLPNTENWLRKFYNENDDNNMSNETKRETN